MINIFKLDEMLEAGKGKEYHTLEVLKNCELEYQRVLGERKKEFGSAIPNFKARYNENSFPYKNKLEMMQKYEINYGDATIETAIFPLPVSGNTAIEFAEITSAAKIPCLCWEGVRDIIAKENGLVVKGDSFYKKIDSVENLMNGILSARKAGRTLELSKTEEDKRRVEQGYVSYKSLKPVF